MPKNFSNSNWQNNKVISAINRYVLMTVVLYSSHEFAFKFVCFKDFKIYTMFYFISSFYYFLNVYTCVICASKTGSMLLVVHYLHLKMFFYLENNLYFVESFTFALYSLKVQEYRVISSGKDSDLI